jgi:DNA-binding XRE family transcriptional regulator
MAGHRNFNELRAKLDARPGVEERRAEARERLAAEDAAYEATLSELRRALELTQEQVAETLELSQAQVSRIERQGDLFLSTLERYIEAMGGDLELIGRFGDERVTLAIGDVAEAAKRS